MDIKITNLNFNFENHPIFTDFSMEIPAGNTACVMGESGCGKTTLLRLLTGQLTGYTGTLEPSPYKTPATQKSVWRRPGRDRAPATGTGRPRYSVVFQDNLLCEDFSAKVNIKLACSRGCYPDRKAPTENQILSHLTSVGLVDVADKQVSLLSGGMKRRVAIVRAILSAGDLLLMDEPFKGLDEATKQQVIRYVLEKKGDRTLLVVTHDIDEARALGGTIIRL